MPRGKQIIVCDSFFAEEAVASDVCACDLLVSNLDAIVSNGSVRLPLPPPAWYNVLEVHKTATAKSKVKENGIQRLLDEAAAADVAAGLSSSDAIIMADCVELLCAVVFFQRTRATAIHKSGRFDAFFVCPIAAEHQQWRCSRQGVESGGLRAPTGEGRVRSYRFNCSLLAGKERVRGRESCE